MSEKTKRAKIALAQKLIVEHWNSLGYVERRQCEELRDVAVRFLIEDGLNRKATKC